MEGELRARPYGTCSLADSRQLDDGSEDRRVLLDAPEEVREDHGKAARRSARPVTWPVGCSYALPLMQCRAGWLAVGIGKLTWMEPARWQAGLIPVKCPSSFLALPQIRAGIRLGGGEEGVARVPRCNPLAGKQASYDELSFLHPGLAPDKGRG